MHPTRAGLAGAMRILAVSGNPDGAKFDGGKAHRMSIVPEKARGLVSTMCPGGLFCANTVDAFGAVSSWGNCDRLANAVRRRALKLVGNNDFSLLLFPDGSLGLAESEIFDESPIFVIFF